MSNTHLDNIYKMIDRDHFHCFDAMQLVNAELSPVMSFKPHFLYI